MQGVVIGFLAWFHHLVINHDDIFFIDLGPKFCDSFCIYCYSASGDQCLARPAGPTATFLLNRPVI